ncbi:MAG: hypothetical protein AB2A00_00420 [Myxococcota bacterium]
MKISPRPPVTRASETSSRANPAATTRDRAPEAEASFQRGGMGAGRAPGPQGKHRLEDSPLGAVMQARGVGGQGAERVYASVDLGSSSVKMLVLAQSAEGRMRVVDDVRIGANLGKDLGADGTLPPANQQRVVDALEVLLRKAAEHGVAPDEIPLIATAAVRNAPNGNTLMERLRTELGLTRARVLTGEEEAQTGYLAALSGIDRAGTDRFVTLDLGGGSFQLAIGNAQRMEQGGSTQLGSNRVQSELLPAGVIRAEDYAAADARLTDLAPLPLPPEALRGRTLAAVGGVSLFLKTHFGSNHISAQQIDALRREIGALDPPARAQHLLKDRSPDERRALGAETPEGAVDVATKLPAKLTLLLHIMRAADLPVLHVSDADARHLLIQRRAGEG